MEIIYQCCCGLDIHKKRVVACLMTSHATGKRHKEIRTFRTVTSELLALHDWLREAKCTHIAMQATGVYWKPAFNLLEGQFELLVVNAQHIKAGPGRKTDVRDAEWIADLLQHGLLTSSFIPATAQRELRDLTRHRVSLVEDRARVVNRLQKVLEETNIKLGDVATAILGKSARAMLDSMLGGQSDPQVLAKLARGRLRAKRAELEQALVGVFKPHHRFLLSELLTQIDTLDEALTRVSNEIATRMQEVETVEPDDADKKQHQTSPELDQSSAQPALTWAQAIILLCTIPGISRRAAEGILAELGLNMDRFPSCRHLASWAGMCPGNHESAGKRLSGKTRKGNAWLRKLLIEAAHAAAHTKNTSLSAQYHRLAGRRGKKKAMVAVGHTILVIIYHVLRDQKAYQELGGHYFDEHDRQGIEKRLVRRLEKLGYEVSLTATSPAA